MLKRPNWRETFPSHHFAPKVIEQIRRTVEALDAGDYGVAVAELRELSELRGIDPKGVPASITDGLKRRAREAMALVNRLDVSEENREAARAQLEQARTAVAGSH